MAINITNCHKLVDNGYMAMVRPLNYDLIIVQLDVFDQPKRWEKDKSDLQFLGTCCEVKKMMS